MANGEKKGRQSVCIVQNGDLIEGICIQWSGQVRIGVIDVLCCGMIVFKLQMLQT